MHVLDQSGMCTRREWGSDTRGITITVAIGGSMDPRFQWSETNEYSTEDSRVEDVQGGGPRGRR